MHSTSQTHAVEIEALSFAYHGEEVLRDVNLVIEQRDFVCIVGPNGGGKSTLLRLILGLLAPEHGRVRVFGLAPEAARPRVGYMPQHSRLDPLFPVTVMDVVLMGRSRPIGFATRADRTAAEDALREVRMHDLRRHPFSELSGGQRQRTLIARALACTPDLLLLDEPTASLDPQLELTLRDLLVKLNERMTVVTVTHDLGFVSQVVKRVVCVNRDVVVHPTSDLTGEHIVNLYGGDMRLVHHDQRCAEKGHVWPAS